jgi:secreted PhoX family phosphatase
MQHQVRSMSGAGAGETFAEVLARRVARRSFLKGAFVGGPLLLVFGSSLFSLRSGEANHDLDQLGFQPISLDDQDRVLVPLGYEAQAFIRWGDPLFADAPPFDPFNQSREAQEQQVGYNHDFVGFFPLPQYQSGNSNHGLLAVNHEFTNSQLMFPGYKPGNPTQSQVDVEIAAHGISVVEVEHHPQQGWRYRQQSPYNRHITGETEITITGPAAGHDLLKVSHDPTGTRVRGTLNNCAGGKTPWGTL